MPDRRPRATAFLAPAPAFALALAIFAPGVCAAQPYDGEQDAGFISNGKYAYQSVVDGNFRIWDVAVSPTDLVVVAGTLDEDGDNLDEAIVWQVLDTDGGVVRCDVVFASAHEIRTAKIAFDSEGRLVVAGSFAPVGDDDRGYVGRFLFPTCDPDPALFGGDIGDFSAAAGDDDILDVAVDANDRIVLVGGISGTVDSTLLVRLLESGGFDTAFDGDGIRLDTPAAAATPFWNAVTILPSGKIAVAGFGEVTDELGSHFDFVAGRYSSSGLPDNGFSGDGFATYGFDLGGSNDDVANELAYDPRSGRLYLAGSARDADGKHGAVAAFDSAGAPVPSWFSTFPDKHHFRESEWHGVVVDGRGRITVAGRSFEDAEGPNSDYLLFRYLSDGQSDLSFGATENGEARIAFDLVADGDDIARGVAFHQGYLVLGGEAERSSGPKLAALRLHVKLVFADGFESGSLAYW